MAAHLPLDPQHLRERGLDEVEERHPRLGVEMLADVADGHPGRADDLPVVGLFLLEEQAEQGRLAGAVAADQPDVLAGVVLPRDALEDVVRAVAFLDVVEAVEHARSLEIRHLAHSAYVDHGPRLHPHGKLRQRRGDGAIELGHPARRGSVEHRAAGAEVIRRDDDFDALEDVEIRHRAE